MKLVVHKTDIQKIENRPQTTQKSTKLTKLTKSIINPENHEEKRYDDETKKKTQQKHQEKR